MLPSARLRNLVRIGQEDTPVSLSPDESFQAYPQVGVVLMVSVKMNTPLSLLAHVFSRFLFLFVAELCFLGFTHTFQLRLRALKLNSPFTIIHF